MYGSEANDRRLKQRHEAIVAKTVQLLDQRDECYDNIKKAERETEKLRKRIARINETIAKVDAGDEETIARLLKGEQQQEQQ